MANNDGRRFALIQHTHLSVQSEAQFIGKDGMTAPATKSSYFQIYVDSADNSLKVKFGNGTVKTLATNP
jgi:hypothetical protein